MADVAKDRTEELVIAGIDFSTKAIDVVLLDDDTDAATWHRAPLVGVDAFDRARVVRAMWFLHFGSALLDDVVAIGIEDPRGYGAGSLYRIQGAILGCLPRTTLVHPLIPSSWRKTVGLPGNATKEQVSQFVVRHKLGAHPSAATVPLGALPMPHGVFWTQDACDAYCLALATRSLIELGEAA